MSKLMEENLPPVPSGEFIERFPTPEEEKAMELIEAERKREQERKTYHVRVTWYDPETVEETLQNRPNRGPYGVYYLLQKFGTGYLPLYIADASSDGYSGMPLSGFEMIRVQFGEIHVREQVSSWDAVLNDLVNLFTYSVYVNLHCGKNEKNLLLRNRFTRSGFELSARYEVYAKTSTPFAVDRISVHQDAFRNPMSIMDTVRNYA